jgi:hypothetical protein
MVIIKNQRILNTTHSMLHSRIHYKGSKDWISGMVDILDKHDFRNFALRHCPVCTSIAIFIWFKRIIRRGKDNG